MPELLAKGSEAIERWRRTLVEGAAVRLGRSPPAGWAVPWDHQISREHVELTWSNGTLTVRSLPAARNPIFFRGQAVGECTVATGEHFVIGSTSFYVVPDEAAVSTVSPVPLEEHLFRPGDLRRIQFRNADHRLEVLSQLPQLIAESTSDDMFTVRLVSLLLAGIPEAEAAALVRRAASEPADSARIEVLQWDRRRDVAGRFQPSQRLIAEALNRRQSVLHAWSDTSQAEQAFTASENLDWAFCTPVPGEACRDWALYVAGSSTAALAGAPGDVVSSDRKGDLRFAELVAELVGSLRQVRRLEDQRAGLRHFLPPPALDALGGEDWERVLAPREGDVTILFCDVRGFSKEVEQWRDKLERLLHRVSEALGVMTHQISRHGGVIGHFQGDAAMGFWGWPFPLSDGPRNACLAALDIRAAFGQAALQPGHPLADFRVGIGIAHGRAVAGKIGTADHAQVTVFGPVANLASRLESMTKQLRAPILLDEATAQFVRERMPPSQARTRRLGHVRPYGLETPLMVSELLPPLAVDPTLSDQNVADYNAAIDAFLAGRWSEALELLHTIPTKDRAKDFLMIYIVQNNYEPPPNWDKTIPMPSK